MAGGVAVLNCVSWRKWLLTRLLRRSRIGPFGVWRKGVCSLCRTNLNKGKEQGRLRLVLAPASNPGLRKAFLGQT